MLPIYSKLTSPFNLIYGNDTRKKKRKTHPKPGHGALKVSGIQVPKMAARAMDGFCDALVGVPFQQKKEKKTHDLSSQRHFLPRISKTNECQNHP